MLEFVAIICIDFWPSVVNGLETDLHFRDIGTEPSMNGRSWQFVLRTEPESATHDQGRLRRPTNHVMVRTAMPHIGKVPQLKRVP